jgi:SAM-dependent methyltransferase
VSWGEADPYLAVLGYLPDGRPWDKSAFYASGKPEWEACRGRWDAYGFDETKPILDLGCGAGRVTRFMVQTYPEVIGVDVSAAQIELAREAVAGGLASCTFHVSDGATIPIPSASVGSVFSMNVFQHLEQRTAESLVNEVGRVLAPRGTAMVHIPVPGSNLTTTYARVLLQRAIDPARAAMHRIAHKFGGLPAMRARVYDTAVVFRLMKRAGLDDLELCLFQPEPKGMYFSFFFGRKTMRLAGIEPATSRSGGARSIP